MPRRNRRQPKVRQGRQRRPRKALHRRQPRINFMTSIGAAVPPSIELYVLPDAALSAVPDAKIVKYTTVQNRIVLVDPTTMRVVDVIPASAGAP